ncbi:MAG: membrane protein insertase YidC [Clostridia bacterium]|nr:membrane protein insertase YidC [Clostridia bacterium]
MLTSQLGGWTQDMWSAIIGLFSFIPNWGWMIIVFTILLKIILSPLDYFQRRLARKNAQKQAALQPELLKIQKKFGNNKQLLNQKTMELYKRENYNLMGSCWGMLINMAITLFIFFTLFSGLTGISQTNMTNEYKEIESFYNEKFVSTFSDVNNESEVKTKQDAIFNNAINEAKLELETEEVNDKVYSKALEIMYNKETTNDDYQKLRTVQNAVYEKYNNEIKQGFLWVKNIWRPDTSSSVFMDFNSYQNTSGLFNSDEYKNELKARIGEETNQDTINTITNNLKTEYKNNYNIITYGIQQNYKGSWNGYYILVILAGVITYLSVLISQMQSSNKKKKQKNAEQSKDANTLQQPKAMGFMKFLLPILMIFFTIGYSTLFALYIVTNSIMSTIISMVLLKIFEAQEKKKNKTDGNGEQKIIIQNKNIPEYSRERLMK